MYQIGVDIGGTNIALGLVDENLEMVCHSSVPFSKEGGGEGTAKAIYEQTQKLLAEAGADLSALESIGVAVPGSLDPSCSVVINAHNLGFHNEPLKEKIQKYFVGIPVFLANDANAAALAELHKGAFKGCRTAALFTLGTGVGGGLILGGKMFNGGMNNGVELGHMCLVHGGESCTCGNRGCIETYTSATALIREAVKAMARYSGSLLNEKTGSDPKKMTAKIAIDCAKAGDEAAVKVFNAYVDALGSAIASVCNLLDCERIAIGGGVSAAGDFLFDALRANVAGKSFFEQYAEILPAAMGNDAGIIGAAMLKRNAE